MSDVSVTSMFGLERPEQFAEPQPTRVDGFATSLDPVALDTREQERQLIGYVLANPSAASDDVLALPVEHMSSRAHAILWRIAVERSYAGHEHFDAAGVMIQIRDEHPDFPSLPDQAKNYAIKYGFGGVGVVVLTLAEEVSNGHAARETEKALMSAWQRLAHGRVDEACQIMTGFDPTAGARDRWVTLADAWEAAKRDAENPAAIIPTPWKQINTVLEGGMRARQVYAVMGGPGAGKTASAQQVVDHAAGELGRTVAVFSLEMGQEDLARRQMSTSGRVPMSEVMRPGLDLTKEATEAVDGVLGRIGGRILIDDSEELTVSELRARARLVTRRYKAELIAVDYAQLVEHDNGKLTEYERVSEVVKEIARMAKELRVPVLLLVQPNRNAKYQDRKLDLHDAHGSSAIEKFVAGAIVINKIWDQDDEGNKIPTEFVDFDIPKNRFGKSDVTVRMLSDMSRQRFEEMGS